MALDKKKRILLVDDHAMVREGLTELINREKDLVVCGEAGEAMEALKIIKQSPPDIAIVDITLTGMSGLQLTKMITSQYKKTAVLVLSMHDERVYAERALHAGARGYIMKQEASKTVVTAIRHILRGSVYLSGNASSHLLHRLGTRGAASKVSPVETLTDRELEVFQLIGQGFRSSDIGEKLNLSVKTIETYREHIKNKLNLGKAAELTQAAIAWVHTEQQEK